MFFDLLDLFIFWNFQYWGVRLVFETTLLFHSSFSLFENKLNRNWNLVFSGKEMGQFSVGQ